MNTTPRCKALQKLAAVLERQLTAIRQGNLEDYMASQGALEAVCGELKPWHGMPSTPMERAWAGSVRRLSRSVVGQVKALNLPWALLAEQVAAESTGRAGPVGLDLRV